MFRKYLVLGAILALGAPVAGLGASSSDQPPSAAQLPRTNLSDQHGSLSDKLDADNGVIRPKGRVDPAMAKSPPATGSMAVIPPPGSPDGQKGVQPK